MDTLDPAWPMTSFLPKVPSMIKLVYWSFGLALTPLLLAASVAWIRLVSRQLTSPRPREGLTRLLEVRSLLP